MKKVKIGLVLLGAITAIVSAPAVLAAEKSPAAAEKPATESQTFKGKVDSVDVDAKTVTVDGTVIHTSDSTKITKGERTIKLAEIMTGDQVHGTTRQTEDGKTQALTVIVGKAEEAKENQAGPAPQN